MELDIDDEFASAPPVSKKRKLEAEDAKMPTAEESKRIIGTEMATAIATAFASIGTSHRITPSGRGFDLCVDSLRGLVTEKAVCDAITACGEDFRPTHVQFRGTRVLVSFVYKRGLAAGKSWQLRQLVELQPTSGGGALGMQRPHHKLLVPSLVPDDQDREMLSQLVDYWEGYRGPEDTPADVHWRLFCLDGTVIDSKSGESKKAVASADAKAGGATASRSYRLQMLGLVDGTTLAEMRVAKEMFPLHVEYVALDPVDKCIVCSLRTYVSPLKCVFVRAPVTLART